MNKAGNFVDEYGTVFGQVEEGDIKRLAGKNVDGQGQIWSDIGKVIGQAGLVPGGPGKPEGPFAGFEKLVVASEGFITESFAFVLVLDKFLASICVFPSSHTKGNIFHPSSSPIDWLSVLFALTTAWTD